MAYLFVTSSYLVGERGVGQSLYIWEGIVLWTYRIKEEGHGLPVRSELGHSYL
jgi:hypothetical protein